MRAVLILAALALAGCAREPDLAEIDICRSVLPALHPDGSVIDLRSQGPGSGDDEITLAYRVVEPHRPGRMATVSCGFVPGGIGGQPDLVRVTENGRELSETRLIILRRWWLGETPSQSAGL